MKPLVFTHPPLQVAELLLREAFSKRKLIVMFCRCSVVYEGRSATILGEGDRLVIVKPDGAVLVHRPRGYSPVNWQPDSQLLEAKLEGDVLLVRSLRAKPRELLEIRVSRVDTLIVAEEMVDNAEFQELIDEAEIRDTLARHPELIEPGLRIVTVEKRIEGRGYADIYGVDSQGRHVVIEVKRVTAGREAVEQLRRYVDAWRKENPQAPVRGILVAPSITEPAAKLLEEYGLEFRKLDLKRIRKILEEERKGKKQPSLLSFVKKGGSAG
ncbi:protein of unknown function DUF91 [Pyrolobus fumarii 1A]|uniref:Endonuclease NucS n=1 Tax=Pyrolobus fumarii (strain DSM 11204 / 1A) TaxID=694429 RepID=G0ECJ9_PYRF1|nr:endonuclease NucS [Pyrolobus fumarii]AEM39569.1 protein of unknown function DUF91 [Pyrolobus fumarii 1A]